MIALLRSAFGKAYKGLPINIEYSPDNAEINIEYSPGDADLRMSPSRYESCIETSATDLIEPRSRGPPERSFSCGSGQRGLQTGLCRP